MVTADAISRTTLDLMPLPDDLRAALDEKLPPRWSRNNPVDLAGAETRDTIPEVIDLIVGHPDVDAVLYLGLGIQSNQAELMRNGRFYPDHGIERIVDYHERQDARFAQAAADASARYDKPVLTATELAVTHPDNAGPGRRPGDRPALLPVRQPCRSRARAPLGAGPPPASADHLGLSHAAADVPAGLGAAAVDGPAAARVRAPLPALMRDCLAGSREFGVVLIERGSEVGGGDVRSDVGTVATIVEADELPDGRWALLAVGTRRIRVEAWLEDDPYPLAEVDDWPDGDLDDDHADLLAGVVGRLRRVLGLAAEAGDAAAPATSS